MASAIFAYAFLKAAYAEGLRNPVDAVRPLVKRALMHSKSKTISQESIQDKIKESLGIQIPINVIRYTFPELQREGILELDSKHVYVLCDPNFADPTIIDLEQKSRQQLDRMKSIISRAMIDHNYEEMTPADFIAYWLDTSSLAFFGGLNPAYKPDLRDREINRLLHTIINDYDRDGKFLTDLTEIALGDGLFRAIQGITEYDAAESATQLSSRMSGVKVFFDTGLLIRVLGIGAAPLNRAARELIGLCKTTGCKLSIFSHNIDECQRIFRTVADRLTYGLELNDDVAYYATEHGMLPADILEFSAGLESKLADLGFEILEAPAITEALSIGELELDRRLELDLNQTSVDARITDIKSLSAIYRYRDGQPGRFLEKSNAIFISTNKGLADSSVRYFQALFKEEGRTNNVQLCMTDVVFSTILWTKVPTKIDNLPKSQILAHIMTYLHPSAKLRENFEVQLRQMVKDNKLSEESAARISLSRFVEQVLATEFPYYQTALSKAQFVNIAQIVIDKQKAAQEKIRSAVAKEVRDGVMEELNVAVLRMEEARDELRNKDADIETLEKKIRHGSDTIQAMQIASNTVTTRVAIIVKWIFRGLLVLVVVGVFSAIFGEIDPLDRIVEKMFAEWHPSVLLRTLVDVISIGTLSFLTIMGISIFGLRGWVEKMLVGAVLKFVFIKPT